MSTKPNLKRENTLKVPLNDVEQDQLRKFCAATGQIAPFVRDLVLAHIRKETNRTVEKGGQGRPRHGHVRGHAHRFPGRSVAGAARHLRL